MLQTIREHTQGWIAGIIISLIILTFALWGIHSYLVSNGSSRIVAEVNGVEISKEQLAVAYERLRRQAQVQYGADGNALLKDETTLKSRALNALVETEALKQVSISQGFLISDSQIDNYLQNMPQFQVDGQFSVERFQEILSSTLLSTSDFLDLIKTSLLIDQPKLGVVFTSFSLPDETNYTIGLVNQERDFSYINIPFQYFLSQPITVPSDKIKAYYEQHQNDFMTPEQVNIDYIELSLKELAANFKPTDAVLKNFYNENINSYTQPKAWKLSSLEVSVPSNATQDEWQEAHKKALALVESLNKGQNFTELAQKNPSKVTLSLELMTFSQVPTELQKATAQLVKINQISTPIKTSSGFVILKVIDLREPKIQDFDSVKTKANESYVRRRAEEKFAELRERLADVTYEHPDSLQTASKTLALPIKTSELFTKEKAGKDVSQYKKVRDIAFSNDVLNLQNNSDVIQINPETVIVLRAKSHIASTLLPLKDISKQIEDKLKYEEAIAQTEKFTNEMKARLESGDSQNALAQSQKLTWKEAGFLGRYSTKVDTAILDLAFRLPDPSTKVKTTYGVTRLQNGYAIVSLRAVKKGVVEDKKQYSIFAEQVQNSEGLLEYELYKRSQINQAKINIEN